MNTEQLQRIFEDIIIQRIKVIQNYVKKNVQKLKSDYAGGNENSAAASEQRREQPV